MLKFNIEILKACENEPKMTKANATFSVIKLLYHKVILGE